MMMKQKQKKIPYDYIPSEKEVIIPPFIKKENIAWQYGLGKAAVWVNETVAEAWLKFNEKNRAYSINNLKYLGEQLQSDWVRNGETIKFKYDGTLDDGQHRLLKIIDTKSRVLLDIVIGLDNNAFKTIDTGKARTGADVLKIEGYKNTTNLSAALRFIIAYELKGASAVLSNKRNVSNTEVLAYLHKNTELDELTDRAVKEYKNTDKLLPVSFLIAARWVFEKKHPHNAKKFFASLNYGTGIDSKDNPVRALRNFLQEIHDNPNIKLKRGIKFIFVVKAWNLYIRNIPTRKLSFNLQKEGLPQIY